MATDDVPPVTFRDMYPDREGVVMERCRCGLMVPCERCLPRRAEDYIRKVDNGEAMGMPITPGARRGA